MQQNRERGFSLVELLISITVMAIIFGLTIPFYRKYVAQTELKNVSQDLYLKLVTAHNNAINGVIPKNVSGGPAARYYWVVRVAQASSIWEYETGACPLSSDPSQFSFTFCGVQDFEHYSFPARFSLNNQYSGSASEVNIYFEPISGQVKIYDISGLRLDDPADTSNNSIDMTIQSTDYSGLYVKIHVNKQGTISQESS